MSGISFSRTTVLTVVMVVELLVVLFFVARWYSRKWGWRSTFRRIRRYVWVTLTDLASPVVKLYRFSRNVRAIAAGLDDPELGGVLQWATTAVEDGLAGEPDAHPYAALVSPQSVALAVAGPVRPQPLAPWTEQLGWWTVPRTAITPGPDDAPETDRAGHVAIGAEPVGVTLLSLHRAPGVVEITGPFRPAFSLICGIAAQLLAGLPREERLEVIVTAGVHPRFRGRTLRSVLLQLRGRMGGPPADRQTVLICGELEAEDAELVTELTAALPTLRVLTAGPYPGRRWKLPVTADGRVEAPELGLSTDSAPLERGVAGALKRRAKRERLAASAAAWGPVEASGSRGADSAVADSREAPEFSEVSAPNPPSAGPEPAQVVVQSGPGRSDGSARAGSAPGPDSDGEQAEPTASDTVLAGSPGAWPSSSASTSSRSPEPSVSNSAKDSRSDSPAAVQPAAATRDLDEPDPVDADTAGQHASSAPRDAGPPQPEMIGATPRSSPRRPVTDRAGP